MPLSSRRTPSLEDLGVERADWGELGPEFYRVWGPRVAATTRSI